MCILDFNDRDRLTGIKKRYYKIFTCLEQLFTYINITHDCIFILYFSLVFDCIANIFSVCWIFQRNSIIYVHIYEQMSNQIWTLNNEQTKQLLIYRNDATLFPTRTLTWQDLLKFVFPLPEVQDANNTRMRYFCNHCYGTGFFIH